MYPFTDFSRIYQVLKSSMDQCFANFSAKGQTVNILSSAGHSVSVGITQQCCYCCKKAKMNYM